MHKENKINTVVENTFKNLNEIIDVNTVVGQPFEMDNGDKIFPISKVTFFTLCGGGEYGKIGFFDKGKDLPFSAGNGSIVSLNPCGFLVKTKNKYEIINVGSQPFEKLIDKVTDIIEKIQGES